MTQFIAAIFFIISLKIIHWLVLKPLRRLNVYRTIPNSTVTYRIGPKDIKEWCNSKKVELTTPDRPNPIFDSEMYRSCLEYPELRFTAANFLSRVVLVIQDTRLMTEFFKKGKFYRKISLASFFRKNFLNFSLLFTEGDEWKLQRKILSEAFHFESIRKTLPIIQETAKEFLGGLKFEGGNSMEVNIIDEFHKITGEVIGRTFFGQNLNQYTIHGKPMTLAIAEFLILSAFGSNLSYQFFGKLSYLFSAKNRQIRREAIEIGNLCRQIVQDTIEKLEKNPPKADAERKGILQILWEKSKTEKNLNEKELIANFLVFFIAGMDTTGHTIALAVYFMSQYPEVKDKVLKEIDAKWDGKSELTLEILQSMDYLQATIDETLRMASPSTGVFPRVSVEDHYLNDVPVPKGTVVFPLFISSMLNQNLYKDVWVFRPERFLRGHPDYERPTDPFAYTPFSAGSRNCIGQHMALLEAKIILCHFLKMYDFRLQENYKMEMVVKFLMEPKNPLKFTLTRRNPSA